MARWDGHERLSLLPADWPDRDRALWHAARTGGGILDDHGLAAHWSTSTVDAVQGAYGCFLGFLDRQGALDTEAMPSARLSRSLLRTWIEELRARLAPATVASRLRNFSQALRVMEPGCDRKLINKAGARLDRLAEPCRDKRARVAEPDHLMEAGLAAMERAAHDPAAGELLQAAYVRNGLLVAMLAARPIRLSNLAALRIDRSLIARDGAYWIEIDGSDSKTGQAQWMPLPDVLTVPIEVYLSTYRPRLLGPCVDDHLWISIRRGRMSSHAIYCTIVELTRTALGHPVNPHLFRDSAMTALANRAPRQVRAGARLLGHRSLVTGERHYNHADQASAVRIYHEALADVLDGKGDPT